MSNDQNPAAPKWAIGRNPATGEQFERVGTLAWEMPEFKSHAPRGYAIEGEFDGYAFHLSLSQMERLRKQYRFPSENEFQIALLLCDALYLTAPPPKDGRMQFRIKAFLKKESSKAAKRPA